MARTATKPDEVKELELPIEDSTADIHHMVRTIAATNSPDQIPPGAVTADQADAQIRTWLERGFRLHTAMAIQPGDVNGVFTLQVLYILTKA